MKEDKEPISDHEFLCKLIVGIGEVAEITGIPTRQIRYWEEKGIITSVTEQEGRNRRYDYDNVKKMLAIKIMLDEGYTLDAAFEKMKVRWEYYNATMSKFKAKSKK